MGAILVWLWRQRALVGAGLVVLLVVDGLQVAVPLLIKAGIDDLAQGGTRLGWYAGGIAALAAVIAVLRFFWRWFLIGAARRIRRDLRQAYFARLLRLSPAWYDGRSTGDLMSIAASDLEAVGMACGFGVMAAFDALFLVVATGGAMFWLDPRLTAVALAPLPIMAVFELLAGRSIHRRFRAVQDHQGVLTERIRETLAGLRVIRGSAREDAVLAAISGDSQEQLRLNRRLIDLSALFDPMIALLAGSAVVVTVWWGAPRVMAGDLSLGTFVAMLGYLTMLTWPMLAIGWVVNLMQRGAASMARIGGVLDAPVEPRPTGVPEGTELVVQGLSFSYPGGTRPALVDLAFTLPQGGILGVVGASGSGKSTLVALLTGLYLLPAGSIRLGGRDLAEVDPRALRQRVAVVPQEPFLFALSVRDNLALGRPDATDGEIAEAARLACLDTEIAALPQGYDTLLGERGVSLSGGQRQRLAIARALLCRAPILILDDSLSAVDGATEAAILAHLREAFRGRTVVVIAHRLSAVAAADEILVLDHGRIAERGRHGTLASAGGLYSRLVELQGAEEAEAAS